MCGMVIVIIAGRWGFPFLHTHGCDHLELHSKHRNPTSCSLSYAASQ